MTLSPDVDVYGKYARVSALADYVELLALKERPISEAQLSDLIEENDWSIEESISRAGVIAPAAADDDPGEEADRIFTLIREREDLLGALYPFEIRRSRVCLRAGFAINTSAYIALLAITMVHAYAIDCLAVPYRVFEDTVAGVAASRGLLTANVGAVAMHAASFEAALDQVAGMVGLKAFFGAAPTYTYAQDEKVDTLCHLTWGDTRPGAWTMVGQATCAKSEAWNQKICEPRPPTWAKLLGVSLFPQAFLAVPHHVGRPMLEKLVSDHVRLVLDRPRLAKYKNGVSADETIIIEALLAVEVEGI